MGLFPVAAIAASFAFVIFSSSMTSGIIRVPANLSPFFNDKISMAGSDHHLTEAINCLQPLIIYF